MDENVSGFEGVARAVGGLESTSWMEAEGEEKPQGLEEQNCLQKYVRI